MPSQRRDVVVGAGNSAVTSLPGAHGAKFCYSSLPGCTPQAHCRSESLQLSYALTPMADVESWFPSASGLAEVGRMTCGGASSPAVSQNNFQRPSEKPLGGGCNIDDEVVSAGVATGHQLGDYQAHTWWPAINVHAMAAKDHHTSPQHGMISDAKPARTASTFTSCDNMEAWCHDSSTNPVAVVADVDLNAPSCELPSAIAVVSVAAATATGAGPDVLLSTRVTKGGSGKLGATTPKQKGKSISAPTSPSERQKSKDVDARLGVQHKSGWNGKRPVSQRENHIWSERQRRKGMNYLFSTLRSLLPHPTSKTDKSTVVGEIIKYIQSLQVKLDVLTKKRQHVMAARTLSTTAFQGGAGAGARDGAAGGPTKAFICNGLTLVDHSSEPACLTAITALPLPGCSESGLQSYLGSNVGLHVCGLNVFITTSSPRGRRGLLQQLLLALHKHDLDVINATISTTNASIFHCLHCQASPDAELLNNALHSDLQGMITNFEAPF